MSPASSATMVAVVALIYLTGLTKGQTTQRSTSILEGFTTEQINCFAEKKVLFRGQCQSLLQAASCPEGHRLVLDKFEAVNGSGMPVPVCKPCQCCSKNSEIYWPVDGQCHHRIKENTTLCPKSGTEPKLDLFGEGECSCKPSHVRLYGGPSDGACYKLYERGPCRERDVIMVDNDDITVGRCRRDPCSTVTRTTKKTHVQHTDQKCYELDGTKPCIAPEKLEILASTLKPGCVSHVDDTLEDGPDIAVRFVLATGERCHLDPTSRQCIEDVTVDTGNEIVTAKMLLDSACKQRGRGGRKRIPKCNGK